MSKHIRYDRLLTAFWIYCSFILTFNEMLGLFIPRVLYRGIYIVLLLLILFIIVFDQKGKITFRRIDKAVLLYFGYVFLRWLIQLVLGNVSQATNTAALQAFIPMLTFFLAIYLNEDQSEKIENWFSIFVSISIILGLIDGRIHFLPQIGIFAGGLYAATGNGTFSLRAYSMSGNALVTGFIAILVVGFCLQKKDKRHNVVYIIIGMIGVFASLSRGALSALVLVLVSFFILKLMENEYSVKRNTLIILGLLACAFILYITINWSEIVNSSFWGRFINVGFSNAEGSNSARDIFHDDALKAFKEKIIFGRGFGFTGYQAVQNSVSNMINTESYFLSLGISCGIIGIFLFSVIFIEAIVETFIYSKSRINNTLIKYGAIVIGMIAWSFMYILLESDLNAIFLWYCIGRINKLESSGIL